MARRCRASAYLHQKMRGTRKSGITDRFGATDAPRAARARIRIAANQDLTAAVGCIPGTRKSWLPHVEKEEEKEAPVSHPQVLVFGAGTVLCGDDRVDRDWTAVVARAVQPAGTQANRGLRCR